MVAERCIDCFSSEMALSSASPMWNSTLFLRSSVSGAALLVVTNEPLVKLQKGSNFVDSGWSLPLRIGLDLFGLGLDAVGRDDESTEVDSRDGEETFRLLGEKLLVTKFGEHES